MELKEMSLKELKKYDTYLFTIADIEVRDKEIERLKTELQETKEHLGEYLHEQEEENKRLNNNINKGIEAINVYQNEKTLSVGYQDLKRIKGILQGNEFDLQMFEEYLQELKGSDKDA